MSKTIRNRYEYQDYAHNRIKGNWSYLNSRLHPRFIVPWQLEADNSESKIQKRK